MKNTEPSNKTLNKTKHIKTSIFSYGVRLDPIPNPVLQIRQHKKEPPNETLV